MSDAPPPTPAGWYPHPDMENTQRYWNGTSWTDQVAPTAQVPAPMPPARHNPYAMRWDWFLWSMAILIFVLIGIGIYNSNKADDQLDCSLNNVDRALNGQTQQYCD